VEEDERRDEPCFRFLICLQYLSCRCGPAFRLLRVGPCDIEAHHVVSQCRVLHTSCRLTRCALGLVEFPTPTKIPHPPPRRLPLPPLKHQACLPVRRARQLPHAGTRFRPQIPLSTPTSCRRKPQAAASDRSIYPPPESPVPTHRPPAARRWPTRPAA
jgi:hypothetical protein